MKKIFTLLVTMCTVFCAYATDMTFDVAVEGTHVTVTPSVADELYFCASVDDATLEMVIELFPDSVDGEAFDLTLPENLFTVATAFYQTNLFTGVQTLVCPEGHQYLVMSSAEQTEDGKILPTGAISVQELTLTASSGDDEPELEPLTFTLVTDNNSFTVTPSDDEQEYVAVVAPKAVLDEMLGMLGLTIEGYAGMMAQYGQLTPYIYQGETTHTVEEYADEDDELTDGLYLALVFGVKRDGNLQIITTTIYQYEWLVEFTSTSISDVETAAVTGKLMKDGKIIINGRVRLDGTLLR